MDKNTIANWFEQLQDDICTALEKADGTGKFREDKWERPGGGGGRTRVLSGAIIEKGGVNFSAVYGELTPNAAAALGVGTEKDFFATGVSIVLHPHHPLVPIIHMNVRYFEINEHIWWFGGGIDLTPHYINPDEARFFHNALKKVCDQHHPTYYPRFKKWADEYFFIRHRQETRGIGGIFFDRLAANENTKENLFAFVQDVGKTFAPVYTPLMQNNASRPFSDEQKTWQLLRRGRYVEFNLVWDRGTKFGLETDGRTESILMSLPAQANWLYDHQPNPQSPEALTLAQLKKGINWL